MLKGTVGIVGGNGWIGRSIGRAMLKSGFIDPAALVLSSRSGLATGYSEWPGIRATSDNGELAERADVIVLAVRPDQFASIRIDASGKLVVSVMAGVSVAALRAGTNAERIVRAMPNAASQIGRSYTPWYAATAVPGDDRQLVQGLCETFGSADEVPREADIDYLTGLTGSGPAFPALLASAMLSHALAQGLAPDVARRAVTGVVAGAGQLVTEQGEPPDMIVRRFMDYRGTTAAGLRAMMDRGFQDAVHAGLSAAEAAALDMARPFRFRATTDGEFVDGAVPSTGYAAAHRAKRENT
jgi:pyrroline-5-carboxylate reductase